MRKVLGKYCWVWNDDKKDGFVARVSLLKKHYDDKPYIDEQRRHWKNAKILTAEKLAELNGE